MCPFQPIPAGSRLAAAVTLRTLRAEDRGAAQVPPPRPLRDGGQPRGCEGISRGPSQRAGTTLLRPMLALLREALVQPRGRSLVTANGAFHVLKKIFTSQAV